MVRGRIRCAVLQPIAERDPRIRRFETGSEPGAALPRVLNRAIDHMQGDFYVYASKTTSFRTGWQSCMPERWKVVPMP